MKKTTFLLFFLLSITSFAQISKTDSTKKINKNTASVSNIQLIFGKVDSSKPSCLPNTILTVANPSGFGSYQWYYENTAIPLATTNSYSPTQAGYYHVTAIHSSSGTTEHSNDVPVSICPLDTDNDGINNNVDVDLDNDGIHNGFEAGGPLLNQSNPLSDYQYTGSVTGTGTIEGKPYYGFVSEIAAGRAEYVTYNLQLTSPTNVKLQNLPIENQGSIQIADPSEYLNSTGDFIVKVPLNRTLTILNPNNVLLIDTNYDGMYESGVTEFSSFEIRFRLNGTTPLKPGIPFSISSYLTDFISYTHHNLSDTSANKASFAFVLPYLFDRDSDGIPDLLDLDSDNDGIPDQIEMRGKDIRIYSGIDTDKNGLDDAFMPIFAGIDSDNDNGTISPIDRVDLDSDNDGIYDLVESGSNAVDSNNDGVIDGSPASFGTNGLHDSLETFPDSGILNYTIADTDGDGTSNYIDLDSDGDSCNDVTDAGFTDPNNDGQLGDAPISSNSNGLVTSRINGYTTPDPAYLSAAKIIINTQPANQSNCELQNVTFTIATNLVDSYQWQLSTNGTLWTNILDNSNYSGSLTNALLIKNLALNMQNYQYRVALSKNGNLCGITSNAATLSVLPIPTITSPVTLIQCDDTAGGLSTFNLTEKNNFLSTNYRDELFTYYTSAAAANTKDTAFLINNPISYSSTSGSVWIRVENSNGCFSVAELSLIVSVTKIPNTFNRTFSVCDDYLDRTNDDKDGITSFDFTSVTNDLKSILPAPSSLYSITYYKTESDALSEIDEITNTSNYRNIGSPNQQKIWVRIENILDNSCYGLGEHITLQVQPLPNIEITDPNIKTICSNLSSYYVQLDAGIQDSTPTTDYTYVWKKEGAILTGKTSSTLDVNTEGLYSVEVTSIFGCSRIREIKVVSSNTAQIEKITLKNVIQGNILTVNATVEATGPGSYEYSLDTSNGPFQNFNLFENISSGNHQLFVKDKNGCGITSKQITVPIQIAADFTHIFYNCDDYLDNVNNDTDGISNFDFTSIKDDLIARLPASLYSIKYYQNKNDALFEKNEITNISNYRNTGSPTDQKVWVRIQNTIDNLCYGLGSFVTLHVTAVPDIDANDNHNDDQLVCSNLSSFFVKLNAGIKDSSSPNDYAYIWKKDGEILNNEKQATLDVNTEGLYSVEVISLSGCSKIRNIKVSSSNLAQINKITVKETDDSNANTIIVETTGPGDYEYSLDNQNGPFQSSNIFENIPLGIHDVYVNDKNGCGIISQSIGIVGAPKFFTPNADGHNDYWNVLGLNTDMNKNSIVNIYDRYGKLIKELRPSDLGWDGTFAGNLLPADDYWYTAKFENGKETKGHFSLKR
ncbi:gliding motility-associated C-terminal domain-containing protein [Flavobacterium aquidurense]|uniref:Gliding motility-associated C-terminal domain-containing protein n=1 Tax=Flavobacterium frigidimaris TaxID=262320 RepID=A0ABX4BND2_FLAFR|nr:T9SS type B sorting domain-containing protein [Flavobacterium frigidimaris]OXA77740.1 hypothetical protein B0A65_15510 [Flavobacterium frigidimaris]SDY87749.1 gliding motility-associated C-terminal domain-containing protein [Flavobacterium aquidurense]